MRPFTGIERRIISFVDGFALLHRMGPTAEDVYRYFDKDQHEDVTRALINLHRKSRALVVKHGRFKAITTLRSEVFVCVRRFNRETCQYEQTLEPYNADAVRLERREDHPPQDAVVGEGSHR